MDNNQNPPKPKRKDSDQSTYYEESVMMDKQEMKTMVENYQLTIKQFNDKKNKIISEIQLLERTQQELKEKLEKTQEDQIHILEAEEKIKFMQQEIQFGIQEINNEHQQLKQDARPRQENKMQISLMDFDEDLCGDQEEEKESEESSNEPNHLKIMNSIPEFPEQLQKRIDEFITQRKVYRDKIIEITGVAKNEYVEAIEYLRDLFNQEIISFELKSCINCQNKYSGYFNDKNSCSHHTGKLKFYSCKECGSDQYYQCCGKCIQCSTGCTSSRHISI